MQHKNLFGILFEVKLKLSILFALFLSACAGRNGYLQKLDCGTDYLWDNRPTESLACFDAAEPPKDYEQIMQKTYMGVGYLSLGDQSARQMFLRAYNIQAESVQANSAEISRLTEEFNDSARKISGFPNLDDIVSSVNAELDRDATVQAMRDFVNPYATWLAAVYDGVANNDLANSENFLKRVQTFAPDNQFVKTDFNAIKSKKDSVWVVFENGSVGQLYAKALAPAILRMWNINITVPEVAKGQKAAPFITANGVRTSFLADMDAIVKTDLIKYRAQNIISSVVFETVKVAATVGTVIGAHQLARNSRQNAGLFAVGGFLVANAIMSQRMSWDLSSWDKLPTEVQVARIEMPSDRIVRISRIGEVRIPDGVRNAVIFVRLSDEYKSFVIGKLN